MELPLPLLPATLVRRYKRFLADFTLSDGTLVTGHCANSGSMLGLVAPGSPALLSHARQPDRKLAYTWEMVYADGTWVGIHTGRTNSLVREALEHGRIPELAHYAHIQAEVRVDSASRLDFLLTGPERPPCYVEVKSVTLRQGEEALFPDAVTNRGKRHLDTLAGLRQEGCRAVLLFVVQREDCQAFRPASHIDPAYALALQAAMEAGVEVLVKVCRVDPPVLALGQGLPQKTATHSLRG